MFNNEPEWITQEIRDLEDKLVAVLPPLDSGYHYELIKLSDGQVAVVFVED